MTNKITTTKQRIEVNSQEEAWQKVNEIFPTDYEKDEQSSLGAGYPIYRSTAEGHFYDYICDLNDRLEVNLSTGETVNIWFSELYWKKFEIEKLEKEIGNLKHELNTEKANRKAADQLIESSEKLLNERDEYIHQLEANIDELSQQNKELVETIEHTNRLHHPERFFIEATACDTGEIRKYSYEEFIRHARFFWAGGSEFDLEERLIVICEVLDKLPNPILEFGWAGLNIKVTKHF